MTSQVIWNRRRQRTLGWWYCKIPNMFDVAKLHPACITPLCIYCISTSPCTKLQWLPAFQMTPKYTVWKWGMRNSTSVVDIPWHRGVWWLFQQLHAWRGLPTRTFSCPPFSWPYECIPGDHCTRLCVTAEGWSPVDFPMLHLCPCVNPACQLMPEYYGYMLRKVCQ